MRKFEDIICPKCGGMLEDVKHKRKNHTWINLYCPNCNIEWRV